MPDDVRIGEEPPSVPPPRSAKALLAAAGLILAAAAGAWLVGTTGGTKPGPTVAVSTLPPPLTTATTDAESTTTLPLDDRLAGARLFWTALGAGDPAAAAAAMPDTTPAAADLIGFVASFRPELTVGDCAGFASNAARCSVVVGNGDLLAIGSGNGEQMLLVAEDGWFDLPAVLSTAAARLSLYALEAHSDDLRAACPITGNPQVLGLAIVGSATADCGAYLASLIEEYMTVVVGVSGDPSG